MNFEEFFKENLAQHPTMPLADLKQRWDIKTRGDIRHNPKGWAAWHPEVLKVVEENGDSLAKVTLAVREALLNDGELIPTLRVLVGWAKEIRGDV